MRQKKIKTLVNYVITNETSVWSCLIGAYKIEVKNSEPANKPDDNEAVYDENNKYYIIHDDH